MPDDEEIKNKESLRRKAEHKLRSKAVPKLEQSTLEDIVDLVSELQIHQLELEMQNEELINARDELTRARDRYADLYDFAPVGYITLSKQNIIKEANITACQMLGVKRSDLLKHRFTKFIVPESQNEFYRHWRNDFATGTKQSFEIIIQRHGSDSFWASLETTRYLKDVRVAITDITERKKAEQMKDEFLSLISHELRTPLTVIGGSLKVALDEKASPEEVKELIQSAAENTDILADILENMLELARYQAGLLQLKTEATDIGSVINKVIRKLKEYQPRHKFEISMPGDLPLIEADPLRVERILHNLLENAVKYSPRESTIRVAAHTDGAFLVTSIKDQGSGISKIERENLFQIFSRMGKTDAATGTGLGLVVCQRLLEAHGGWIEVDSAPGQGSTFSFGLPLRSKC